MIQSVKISLDKRQHTPYIETTQTGDGGIADATSRARRLENRRDGESEDSKVCAGSSPALPTTHTERTQMTIQEAIRSGKPFRRIGDRVMADANAWYEIYDGSKVVRFGNDELTGGASRPWETSDILATDWEIKP